METITLASLFAAVTLQFHLPPKLIDSICYVESTYNTKAVHHDDGNGDSLGVCQIKLETAKMMGFPGTAEQLMFPPTNIWYAAAYLNHQLLRYNGNAVNAIISYNQGSTKNLTRTKYSDKVNQQWKQRRKNNERASKHWNHTSDYKNSL